MANTTFSKVHKLQRIFKILITIIGLCDGGTKSKMWVNLGKLLMTFYEEGGFATRYFSCGRLHSFVFDFHFLLYLYR